MEAIRTQLSDSDRTPPDATSPRIVILGAGPTFLAAGYRRRELGYASFAQVVAVEYCWRELYRGGVFRVGDLEQAAAVGVHGPTAQYEVALVAKSLARAK